MIGGNCNGKVWNNGEKNSQKGRGRDGIKVPIR
jgi:hypothetical protein